jgi:hypothetical protein
MRKLVLILVLITAANAPGYADNPVKPLNTDESGLALKGFDAVAYLVDGRAVPGVPQFEHTWGGARWRFSSAANRDRFAQSPEAYAPQFGGYCAWAVSRNYTADIDPEAFDIVGGKLYLNYSKLVQLRWKMSREENIRKAEQNWPRLVR